MCVCVCVCVHCMRALPALNYLLVVVLCLVISRRVGPCPLAWETPSSSWSSASQVFLPTCRRMRYVRPLNNRAIPKTYVSPSHSPSSFLYAGQRKAVLWIGQLSSGEDSVSWWGHLQVLSHWHNQRWWRDPCLCLVSVPGPPQFCLAHLLPKLLFLKSVVLQ